MSAPAQALLNVLFPRSCVACACVEPELRFFCAECAETTEPLPKPRCARCSEPGAFKDQLCPRCTQNAPPFVRAEAPFIHAGAVARAIHAFKYADHPELAEPLAALLIESCSNFLAHVAYDVCALPLHPRRFRHRRYDQAHLLARSFAACSGLTFIGQALSRVRETAQQVGLTWAEREANVEGAFEASPAVLGRSLLLIDDVFTTGATARAATAALLQRGAHSVHVLTLARAHSAAAVVQSDSTSASSPLRPLARSPRLIPSDPTNSP